MISSRTRQTRWRVVDDPGMRPVPKFGQDDRGTLPRSHTNPTFANNVLMWNAFAIRNAQVSRPISIATYPNFYIAESKIRTHTVQNSSRCIPSSWAARKTYTRGLRRMRVRSESECMVSVSSRCMIVCTRPLVLAVGICLPAILSAISVLAYMANMNGTDTSTKILSRSVASKVLGEAPSSCRGSSDVRTLRLWL